MWYAHGRVRQQRDNDYLATSDPSAWPRLFVVTQEVWDRTPEDRRALLEPVGTVHGLAYSDGGRVVRVMVLRNNAAQ